MAVATGDMATGRRCGSGYGPEAWRSDPFTSRDSVTEASVMGSFLKMRGAGFESVIPLLSLKHLQQLTHK